MNIADGKYKLRSQAMRRAIHDLDGPALKLQVSMEVEVRPV